MGKQSTRTTLGFLVGALLFGTMGCVAHTPNDTPEEDTAEEDTSAEDTSEEEDTDEEDTDEEDTDDTDSDPIITVGTPPLDHPGSSLATNLGSFSVDSPEYGFVDAFLKAAPWTPNFCTPSSTSLSEDANRWVTSLESGQCASSFIFMGMGGHYPAGEYVLLWEGDGSFSIENDGEFSHTEGDSAPQSNGLSRGTMEVTPSDEGLYVEITSVATDYLKNIRVIMPGGVCGTSPEDLRYEAYCETARGGEGSCDTGETCYDFEEVYWDRYTDDVSDMNSPKVLFHPEFVERLRHYRAIRYMKWMSTHDSLLTEWSERAPLQKATYADDAEYDDDRTKTTRGVPYEVIVALSNLLGADMYLTVPAPSSNDFNTQLATLVDSQLREDLKVYVEYSNEVWNFDYGVDRQYMLDQADVRGLTGAGTEFVPDGYKLARFYSERATEIFDEWSAVVDSGRLIRVLAGFIDEDYTNEILVWESAHLSADALALGGYFTGEVGFASNETTVKGWADTNDLDAFFNEINNGGIGLESGLDEIDRHYTTSYSLANPLGLRLIAYEGGFGIEAYKFSSGAVEAVTGLNKNAQLDPRMGTATITNLDNWRTAGGAEFFHFNNSDSGMVYGALEYQSQPSNEAPKFQAMMTFIDTVDCWWSDCGA